MPELKKMPGRRVGSNLVVDADPGCVDRAQLGKLVGPRLIDHNQREPANDDGVQQRVIVGNR